MKAEISISTLYYNQSVLGFFFRTQSENTFNELFEAVEESEEIIFSAIENYSDDLDDIEELFYSESVADLCDILGLTLLESEND